LYKHVILGIEASGINSAELTILLPSDLLHNVLVPRGIMSEVAQRCSSGAIFLGMKMMKSIEQQDNV